jgi:hypothetical protein
VGVTRKLTLDDLASGLLQFPDRYLALDVFLADVVDLQGGGAPQGGAVKSDGSLEFERQGRRFNLRIFQELGVARLMLAHAGVTSAVAGVTGAAVGARFSKSGEELQGAAVGQLLGLLVGAPLGMPSPPAPRRVFAVRFDPTAGSWQTYDGGLVPWLKERLAPPEIIEGLPPTPPKLAPTGS